VLIFVGDTASQRVHIVDRRDAGVDEPVFGVSRRCAGESSLEFRGCSDVSLIGYRFRPKWGTKNWIALWLFPQVRDDHLLRYVQMIHWLKLALN